MPPAHCTSGSRINAQISPACCCRSASRPAAARTAHSAAGFAWPGHGRIRGRREQRLAQQRRIHAPVQRDIADRQRADGFTVVPVFQCDELRAPGLAAVVEPMEGHLQRDFHAGRAVVGIEHLGQWRASCLGGSERHQLLGQFHRRRMREAGQDHLFQLHRLCSDCAGDARFRVAEQIGPPAGYGVEVAATVAADQPCTFAALDRHQRQRVRVFAHLGAGVPEHRQVTFAPVVGAARYHVGMVNKIRHPRIIPARGIA